MNEAERLRKAAELELEQHWDELRQEINSLAASSPVLSAALASEESRELLGKVIAKIVLLSVNKMSLETAEMLQELLDA